MSESARPVAVLVSALCAAPGIPGCDSLATDEELPELVQERSRSRSRSGNRE